MHSHIYVDIVCGTVFVCAHVHVCSFSSSVYFQPRSNEIVIQLFIPSFDEDVKTRQIPIYAPLSCGHHDTHKKYRYVRSPPLLTE